MRADRTRAIRDRIQGTARYEDLAPADLVVEAVFEDRALKQDVFRRLEAVCRPDAILATNTSSYLVSQIAEATRHPERVIGLHYFFHPAKNRLVEVIAGTKSDRDVVHRAWMLQEQLGKIPIASADASGFVVNRFFVLWILEAIRLLEERVANAITIDEIAKRAFGVGMGPFELMNVSGVPIALHASTTIGNAFGPLYGPTDSCGRRSSSGRLWSLDGTVDVGSERAVAERLQAGVFLAAAALVEEGDRDGRGDRHRRARRPPMAAGPVRDDEPDGHGEGAGTGRRRSRQVEDARPGGSRHRRPDQRAVPARAGAVAARTTASSRSPSTGRT